LAAEKEGQSEREGKKGDRGGEGWRKKVGGRPPLQEFLRVQDRRVCE